MRGIILSGALIVAIFSLNATATDQLKTTTTQTSATAQRSTNLSDIEKAIAELTAKKAQLEQEDILKAQQEDGKKATAKKANQILQKFKLQQAKQQLKK